MCQEGGSLVTRLRVSRGWEPGNEATCVKRGEPGNEATCVKRGGAW